MVHRLERLWLRRSQNILPSRTAQGLRGRMTEGIRWPQEVSITVEAYLHGFHTCSCRIRKLCRSRLGVTAVATGSPCCGVPLQAVTAQRFFPTFQNQRRQTTFQICKYQRVVRTLLQSIRVTIDHACIGADHSRHRTACTQDAGDLHRVYLYRTCHLTPP